eukprot:CAMPEP_0194245826 /NCGR_PEP_ID=MMETSP0158-20130606/13973_1 /TAXON_ID=33649 /ORGANISM="Thalassionema nitzschioides, Strain L26-B" /LENGTH=69 /DNA_ID=CAMNT_0038981607 /DNA_START=812 /DNA_END=1017 /DNA_ORIENTATION=-
MENIIVAKNLLKSSEVFLGLFQLSSSDVVMSGLGLFCSLPFGYSRSKYEPQTLLSFALHAQQSSSNVLT